MSEETPLREEDIMSGRIEDGLLDYSIIDQDDDVDEAREEAYAAMIKDSTPETLDWLSGVVRKASSIIRGTEGNDVVVENEEDYDFLPFSEVERETEEQVETVLRMAPIGAEDVALQTFLENRVSELENRLKSSHRELEKKVKDLERELARERREHAESKESNEVVHRVQVEALQEKTTELKKTNKVLEKKLEQDELPRKPTGIDFREVPAKDDDDDDSGAALVNSYLPRQAPVTELSQDQIERYSRQLLLQDGFGVEGQHKLLSSSVLVVGAGGIGSTVLMYLAASGVGHISVVDFDQVEKSNLHRQIIHQERNVGMNKAVSACRAMDHLNPSISRTAIKEPLTFENAHELVAKHDCIVDASDNPMTRYLINDACVLANKPLVSGSAMGTEGQLTVYNHNGGPCYRCLYPKPNRAEGCKSCSDNGVLGPVPGLIGVLQSLEALKILAGFGTTMHDRMLMYDSLRCSFMSVKKPPKSKRCPVCGEEASILSMADSQKVTEGARGPNVLIPGQKGLRILPSLRDSLSISCKDYKDVREKDLPHVLLDVRVERQFDMCSLSGAVNIPLANLSDNLERIEELSSGSKPVYCLCRRGIFSVEATRLLSEAMEERPKIASVYNITGGLLSWSKEVDPQFPIY